MPARPPTRSEICLSCTSHLVIAVVIGASVCSIHLPVHASVVPHCKNHTPHHFPPLVTACMCQPTYLTNETTNLVFSCTANNAHQLTGPLLLLNHP